MACGSLTGQFANDAITVRGKQKPTQNVLGSVKKDSLSFFRNKANQRLFKVQYLKHETVSKSPIYSIYTVYDSLSSLLFLNVRDCFKPVISKNGAGFMQCFVSLPKCLSRGMLCACRCCPFFSLLNLSNCV